MKTLSHSARMDMSFDISWTKDGISHNEHYFADQFNGWRDIFPGSLLEKMPDTPAENPILAFEYLQDKVMDLSLAQLKPFRPEEPLKAGRFYPQEMISGIPGIFRGNMTPFRCISCQGDRITVDLNHPMAGIPVSITMTARGKSHKPGERGGSCTDWMDLILSGPGMQARRNQQSTDFFTAHAFDRKDPGPDPVFYSADRFVPHIDATARANLSDLYKTLLGPKRTLLDLMAGWESHIPGEMNISSVHGLGLNASELAKNRQLSGYTVQDLNRDKTLPFNDHTFDAVICSLSVEYLIDPFALFREVARVLTPGGCFAVTFSNRWFPEKAIQIWKDLHDFERMGLVLEYFLESGRYGDLSTISMRGYPRPVEDRYFPEIRWSDPVYAVIGKTRLL